VREPMKAQGGAREGGEEEEERVPEGGVCDGLLLRRFKGGGSSRARTGWAGRWIP
jgi:hypothetical protein